MKIKNLSDWEKGKTNNSDPYGSGIYRYAEKWADLMEGHMSEGKTVAECAKDDSHAADTEGITEFMYGAAVSVLSHVWEYGEELRQWHNSQYGKSGEAANKSGGTVNPAILTLG